MIHRVAALKARKGNYNIVEMFNKCSYERERERDTERQTEIKRRSKRDKDVLPEFYGNDKLGLRGSADD